MRQCSTIFNPGLCAPFVSLTESWKFQPFGGVDGTSYPEAEGSALQGFEMPSELHGIHQFLKAMEERQSWKNTYYTEK